MKKEKVGFTIGKFAPLHKGHQYLIETGIKEMDKFIVVLYETDLIDKDLEQRANWLKELYPNIEIRYAKNPPKQYGLDKESVNIQMNYLTKIVGAKEVTHFYSSEKYGKAVAEYMNIEDRRVDNERKVVPISATKIRNDLEKNKMWLDDKVYNELTKCNVKK